MIVGQATDCHLTADGAEIEPGIAVQRQAVQVLIAEDDPISLQVLRRTLVCWGYEVTAVADGAAAWTRLQGPNPPALAVLDWLMPGIDGVELCRRIRQLPQQQSVHVILLTGRTSKEDIVAGFEAGADDYLIKPFDPLELQARLNVGRRLAGLQRRLAQRVNELEAALSRVKQLQGLLPVCAWCKSIRNDQNYWQSVEDYIATHFEARCTHGICPECLAQAKAKLNRQ
jgi:CheY-like chemotaxis protein